MSDLLVDLTPEHYEKFAVEGTLPWNNYLKQRILEEIKDITSDQKSLLDIGMGTGHMLFDLLGENQLNEFKFNGADLDPEMVGFCLAKVKDLDLEDKVNIVEANVSKLPFADRSFSLIYARSVIHHWAEPELGMQELCRVLDLGGTLLIHEPLSDASAEALELFNKSRHECGVCDMSTEEKYTFDGIGKLIQCCESPAFKCTATLGEGIAALGCEILIKRVK
ncbi:class I SAM-dependent methyltransferase [Vibrio spartinae]|uniref:Demethylrebeccamycin-D-glucose O-methyltransferase n=1 Tax=Vibrio spartinae TaxID=1918945 RepID=A0A1N6M5P3_9VIBR|nr:class I SAM-dependent methyltransferase [Vibrio spartinae]SIO94758.1 Demethylrebeccamycin-D-glucose O-methyltransferase [Vibrio spartinae]